MLNGWILSVVFITLLVSLCNPRGVSDIKTLAFSSSNHPLHFSETQTHNLFSFLSTLQYDFYRESCPNAENIVRSAMALIYSHHQDISASLLRLFFHDCFIQVSIKSSFLDSLLDSLPFFSNLLLSFLFPSIRVAMLPSYWIPLQVTISIRVRSRLFLI